jgi:NADPH:quinone reductase-like Zn-dependent oxidoreductase
MPTMKAVQTADSGVFEVVEAGAAVTGLKPGDRVVVNPQAAPSEITGCGGAHGGMAEYLLIENAVAGRESRARSRRRCTARYSGGTRVRFPAHRRRA